MSPWAARVPVPLRLPALREIGRASGREGASVSVVAARLTTAMRVWLPVMVTPAKTSVEVPAFSQPVAYVQLQAVRMVARRVRVHDDLLTASRGWLPLVVVQAPASVWAL